MASPTSSLRSGTYTPRHAEDRSKEFNRGKHHRNDENILTIGLMVSMRKMSIADVSCSIGQYVVAYEVEICIQLETFTCDRWTIIEYHGLMITVWLRRFRAFFTRASLRK
jgi:hypothetical protein